MSVPNFSSLARLEVPEKFLWGVVVCTVIFMSNPTVVLCCVVLWLGFWQYCLYLQDNCYSPLHCLLSNHPSVQSSSMRFFAPSPSLSVSPAHLSGCYNQQFLSSSDTNIWGRKTVNQLWFFSTFRSDTNTFGLKIDSRYTFTFFLNWTLVKQLQVAVNRLLAHSDTHYLQIVFTQIYLALESMHVSA